LKLPRSTVGFYAFMAQYYQIELPEPTALIYAQELQGHTIEQLFDAWSLYKADYKNIRMPLPNQLTEFLNKRLGVKDAANLMVSKLIGLVGSKGRLWSWHQESEAEIGDGYFQLVSAVIRNRGGWNRFCDQLDRCASEETFRAQLRDELAATVQASRMGQLSTSPALMEPSRILRLISDTSEKLQLGGETNGN